MLAFIVQNLATIIISLALLAIVAFIVVRMAKARASGKGGCGYGCAGCPSSASGGCAGHTQGSR